MYQFIFKVHSCVAMGVVGHFISLFRGGGVILEGSWNQMSPELFIADINRPPCNIWSPVLLYQYR